MHKGNFKACNIKLLYSNFEARYIDNLCVSLTHLLRFGTDSVPETQVFSFILRILTRRLACCLCLRWCVCVCIYIYIYMLYF